MNSQALIKPKWSWKCGIRTLLPHLYVVRVCVDMCVSHLISQSFISSQGKMSTVKQWSRAHLLGFVISET